MSKSVAEIIESYGYEDVVIFTEPDYAEAFMGVTDTNRAVYDFELMVKHLCDKEHLTKLDAIEFIELNTMKASAFHHDSPLILYRLEE